MLPITDAPTRLFLLNHIACKLGAGEVAALRQAGLDREFLSRLQQISAIDLKRLSEMRELRIAVAFRSDEVDAGLRSAALREEAKAMESYFIRNGASTQMMKALFKFGRKVTLKRRREDGAWRPSGRFALPDFSTRKRIFSAWMAIKEPNVRIRYFRLHQRFSQYSIAALAAVIRSFEELE